jgi:probable HAF family extracellular repeat protein
MHDLGTLGGRTSVALGINKTDQVVGIASLNDFVNHAFLYDGTMHDLGTLEGMTNSQANVINNKGQIVGESSDPNTIPTNFRAFFYDDEFHDLGTLGGSTSLATAINDKGVVVGYFQIPSGETHAFLYDGSMHDLGSFDDGRTLAYAINKRGQVVGQWIIQNRQGAFLYQEGTLYDLKVLLDSSGDEWTQLMEAAGINDSGQIVGSGAKADGVHAFRLDPISEHEKRHRRSHERDDDEPAQP